jgi:glycosyltransferase involved in cell wall biosynthesis
MTHISVVIPVYNESSLIDELVKRVKANVKLITEDYEIIIVDDGSQDNTWTSIENEAETEIRLRGIKFSRNFGHHYAITAGLNNAKGDWVVVMDGDLQDRPEVINQLYTKAQQGFDIVVVSRTKRPERIYYKILQKIFYKILIALTGVKFDSRQANFSIINRKVVNAFMEFPENLRFYGTTLMWLGFKRSFVLAEHGVRFSGRPSYTFKKRLKLALDIIIAFSERPLRITIYFGVLIFMFSTFALILMFSKSSFGNDTFLGWQIAISSIFFVGGIILIVLGILGIYLGKIFIEVKRRPLYIISEQLN